MKSLDLSTCQVSAQKTDSKQDFSKKTCFHPYRTSDEKNHQAHQFPPIYTRYLIICKRQFLSKTRFSQFISSDGRPEGKTWKNATFRPLQTFTNDIFSMRIQYHWKGELITYRLVFICWGLDVFVGGVGPILYLFHKYRIQ